MNKANKKKHKTLDSFLKEKYHNLHDNHKLYFQFF
jgi:hypothetical protein